MTYLSPIQEAIECYEQFSQEKYMCFSEMCDDQRLFLISLLLSNKPTKILELGVSAGGSSAIILNTIREFSDTKLYSIDLSSTWYKDSSKETGFIVKENNLDNNNWKLYTGDLALSFMKEIGNDIDFCFIDTAHINPGEILDFLMVFPFLKQNAIVVLHDIALHFNNTPQEVTTNLLLSALQGETFLLPISNNSHRPFQNIGAIKLDSNFQHRIFSVFNLLTLPWSYSLSEKDFNKIIHYFQNFYSPELINIFVKSRDFYQKHYFSNN